MTVAPDRLVDLKELRRLAEQATPGPWSAVADEYPEEVWFNAGLWTVESADAGVSYLGRSKDADAAYIAAANPATILSLLDERDSLRAAYDTLAEDERSLHLRTTIAEQRVAALEEGLRRSAERFHGLVDEGHEFHTFQECPLESCEAARSLLQSSAASQGDSE